MGSIPYINRQPARSVRVPSLSGGMNLRDSLSLVGDTQLTDSLNLWFHHGVLQNRPGVSPVTSGFTYLWAENGGEEAGTVVPLENDARIIRDSREYALSAYIVQFTAHSRIQSCFHCASGETIPVEALSFPSASGENSPAQERLSAWIVQHKSGIFCFTAEETEFGSDLSIWKLSEEGMEWLAVAERDIYAPLVAVHCETNGKTSMTAAELFSGAGVMFEGYNRIGSYYRMTYTSVNRSLLSGSSSTHAMHYFLLENTAQEKYTGKTVTAVITNASGTEYTHSVTLSGTSAEVFEETAPGDGKVIGVAGNKLTFYTVSGGSRTVATVNENDYVPDNLEITAPSITALVEQKKVFCMTRHIWFGGAAAGLNGGAHLFLGGNSEEKEQSLIVWSDLDKPLYFPENNYAYVGNAASAVTAFGKQSELLIIFKENELYYTKYYSGTDYSAEDLINGTVIDVTAAETLFPIIQLHGAIGCDCPDTVQLCGNRLVWLNASGAAYTLTDNNQYSERNVYEVSQMIRRSFLAEDRAALKTAHAADWNGHYLLFFNDTVYAMDYGSYGFYHIYSYAKTDDSARLIPWYVWRLPVSPSAVKSLAGTLLLFADFKASAETIPYRYFGVYTLDPEQNADISVSLKTFEMSSHPEPKPGAAVGMECMAQTKVFDFGSAAQIKKIQTVYLSLGRGGGEPITVSFLNDRLDRDEERRIALAGGQENPYSARFIESRPIRLCNPFTTRLGVRLECRGALAFGGMEIHYRLTGGVKG